MKPILITLMFLTIGCATPKPITPIRTKIVSIETEVQSTNKTLSKAVTLTAKTKTIADKLMNEIVEVQTNPTTKLSLTDIKNTATENLFSIEQTFNTLNTELRTDLFNLQSKSLILQNQVENLSTTIEELSQERSALTTINTKLNIKLEDQVRISNKWRIIGIGAVFLILIGVGLKVYSFLNGGGISGLLSKIL